MAESSDHEMKPKVQLKVLKCRRTGQDYELAEHERCPYCFGSKDELETGDYTEFCDYRRGEDPVNFGFPGDSSRFTKG